MRPTVSVNLIHDMAELFRDRLISTGCPTDEVMNINDDVRLIRLYSGRYRRLVQPVTRAINRSSRFVCPPRHSKAVADIENVISQGCLLTPYLSKRIKRLDYDDLLLNDWRIHHLHLGTAIGPDGFVSRTADLLFVYFEYTNAYLIEIRGHSDFACQELLQIVHENWPNLLTKYRMNGTVVPRLSGADIKKLRNAGVQPLISMSDGTTYAPPGGGITTAGTSFADTMDVNRFLRSLRSEQDRIKNTIQRDTRQRDRVRLKLKVTDNGRYVMEDTHTGHGYPLQFG